MMSIKVPTKIEVKGCVCTVCDWCRTAVVTHLMKLIGWSDACNHRAVTTLFIFALSPPHLPHRLTRDPPPSFPSTSFSSVVTLSCSSCSLSSLFRSRGWVKDGEKKSAVLKPCQQSFSYSRRTDWTSGTVSSKYDDYIHHHHPQKRLIADLWWCYMWAATKVNTTPIRRAVGT